MNYKWNKVIDKKFFPIMKWEILISTGLFWVSCCWVYNNDLLYVWKKTNNEESSSDVPRTSISVWYCMNISESHEYSLIKWNMWNELWSRKPEARCDEAATV